MMSGNRRKQLRILRRKSRRTSIGARERKTGKRILSGRRLLHRIGRIWDIPEKEVMPELVERKMGGVYGEYDQFRHQYAIAEPKKFPDIYDLKQSRSHELVHAADNLIYRKNKPLGGSRSGKIIYLLDFMSFMFGGYPKLYQDNRRTELLANLTQAYGRHKTSWRKGFAATKVGTFAAISYGAPGWAMAIAPKAIAREAELSQQPRVIENLFNRHGEDGLILYLANPPRVFGALETVLWERKMRKHGYLEESGGLTEKGLALLKQKMPREEIIRRLEVAKRNRKK